MTSPLAPTKEYVAEFCSVNPAGHWIFVELVETDTESNWHTYVISCCKHITMSRGDGSSIEDEFTHIEYADDGTQRLVFTCREKPIHHAYPDRNMATFDDFVFQAPGKMTAYIYPDGEFPRKDHEEKIAELLGQIEKDLEERKQREAQE